MAWIFTRSERPAADAAGVRMKVTQGRATPVGRGPAAWLPAICLLPVIAAAGEIERECVQEPVFKGTACIYQANRGAAQTVVLVHGINGGALRDWRHQIEALSADYHVVAVDLPGFGDSSHANELYSPEAYARFLRFVTARQVKRPFYLVGHSMGGAVALRYAAAHPDEVQRLVLIDVAGILHRITFSKEAVGAWVDDRPSRTAGVVERVAGKLLEKLEGFTSVLKPDLTDKEWRRRMLQGDPAEIAAMALLEDDFSRVLPAVRAPTLIVWGAADTVAPPRTARVLAARLPANRLVFLPEVGHVPMKEATAQTNELLRGWFSLPAEQLPPARGPWPLEPVAAGRTGGCDDDEGTREFTGEWRRIELRGCSWVTIRDARVGELEMFESRVTITDSVLVGEQPLNVIGSEVQMTGGAIKGKVAIRAERSRLDFAGVTVIGSESAIVAPDPTKVIMSVSVIESPRGAGPIHGYREVTPETPL